MKDTSTATPDEVENVGDVFLTIARVHNFCINEGDEGPVDNAESEDKNPTFIPSDIGVTILRGMIVEHLVWCSLGRLQYNLERNGQNKIIL